MCILLGAFLDISGQLRQIETFYHRSQKMFSIINSSEISVSRLSNYFSTEVCQRVLLQGAVHVVPEKLVCEKKVVVFSSNPTCLEPEFRAS